MYRIVSFINDVTCFIFFIFHRVVKYCLKNNLHTFSWWLFTLAWTLLVNERMLESYIISRDGFFLIHVGKCSQLEDESNYNTVLCDCYVCMKKNKKIKRLCNLNNELAESIMRLFHKHGAKVCISDIQENLGQHLYEKRRFQR